jgi:hypothetical protein
MTIQEILQKLQSEGVEVSAKDGALHLRAMKGPLTESQRTLLRENKAAILERLSAQDAAAEKNEAEDNADPEAIYKEYVYPDGTRLQLTKAEFQRIANAFRMLLDQETKLILEGKRFKPRPQEEAPMLEPDRTAPQEGNLVE